MTQWNGPTASVKTTAGEKITILSCSTSAIGCERASKGAAAAGKLLGWDTTIVDGKFDPATWNSAIIQAASEHQDGVIMMAVNPALVQQGLSDAAKAKIPVVGVYQPPFPGGPKLAAYVTSNHVQGGDIIGDYIASVSQGKANVLVLNDTEFPEIVQRNGAVVQTLKSACPGCTVLQQSFVAATSAQDLPSQVTALLQQHPSINYVYSPYNASDPFVIQGIEQAGKTSTVKMISAEGAKISFAAMRSKQLYADLASPVTYMGWLAVDQMARVLAHQSHSLVSYVPQRLITPANLASIPTGGAWDLNLNYEAKFKALWGK